MPIRALQHVSVWLDYLSTEYGAFAQAVEWAERLGLPLRVVMASAGLAPHTLNNISHGNIAVAAVREQAPILEELKSWGNACAQRGIPMEISFWVGETDAGIDQFLRTGTLCVFEDIHSDPVRQKMLARTTRSGDVLALLTPTMPQPLSRVLILYHHQDRNAFFVETAARHCQALGIRPLILTMAVSEPEARLKQSFAEGVCSSMQLPADFDSVVSFDPACAAQHVAVWRKCSHVFFERPRNILGISLWQRIRADIFAELRNVADSLSLLAFPEGLTLEVSSKMIADRLA